MPLIKSVLILFPLYVSFLFFNFCAFLMNTLGIDFVHVLAFLFSIRFSDQPNVRVNSNINAKMSLESATLRPHCI